MLLNFASCVVGCAVLALMNVASFLYGLGYNIQSLTGGMPVWALVAAVVLPVLGCGCCFYACLSTMESPGPVSPRLAHEEVPTDCPDMEEREADHRQACVA